MDIQLNFRGIYSSLNAHENENLNKINIFWETEKIRNEFVVSWSI